MKENIREHIKQFPRRKSHYSRSSNRKREYLDEGLSISCMYRLYLDKYEPEAGRDPQAKEWLYRNIFNEEFNLTFGYPRSNTCEMCDLLHVTMQATTSEAEREEMQKELADHQEKASQGHHPTLESTTQPLVLPVCTCEMKLMQVGVPMRSVPVSSNIGRHYPYK